MNRRSDAKGGKLIPALCNIAGTLILLSVIASCLPVTVPRFMGYEIYNVVSGSMEPEIPVGSILYVKRAEPEEIIPGDVIAFRRDGSVITHRVEETGMWKENLLPEEMPTAEKTCGRCPMNA